MSLIWILALAALALLFSVGFLIWFVRQQSPRSKALPKEWALTSRPVFSTDERRVYRQLREALPHHIVLSKLPLVRFCQPTDAQKVRYWYELLGAIHVSFAVCSANGRVLAAIDLEGEKAGSRRVAQIKQAVLNACRVRYLRCPPTHLPSLAELQMLVPQTTSRGATTAAERTAPSTASRSNAKRGSLWQDSAVFQDSFFGADPRRDTGPMSEYGGLASTFGGVPPGVSVVELGPDAIVPMPDGVGAPATAVAGR